MFYPPPPLPLSYLLVSLQLNPSPLTPLKLEQFNPTVGAKNVKYAYPLTKWEYFPLLETLSFFIIQPRKTLMSNLRNKNFKSVFDFIKSSWDTLILCKWGLRVRQREVDHGNANIFPELTPTFGLCQPTTPTLALAVVNSTLKGRTGENRVEERRE